MIERLFRPSEGPPSAFEEALRAAIEDLPRRRVWIIDGPLHGRRVGAEDDDPQRAGFRDLLETGAAHLAAAKAAVREESRQAAVKARALAAFARCRPAELLDRPAEEVGAAAAASRAARPSVLTEVSEWAVDEVAASLGLSSLTAGALLADALTLVEALPATLAALESGTVSWPQARMLADVLAPLKDEARREVEAGLLARAAGKTVAQLKASAVRAVLKADAKAAVARAARAVRERTVALYPGEDGMATLSATFPAPVATACYSALEAYAEACKSPDDERTKAQRMVDCLADLILDPGVNGPVQVQLSMVATPSTLTGGDEPGEVDGQPVPAGMVRELAYAFDLLPRPHTCDMTPGDMPPPAAADETIAPEAAAPAELNPAAYDQTAADQAAAGLGALLRVPLTAGTALAEPPTIAIVDELSGQLLALSNSAEIRRAATCRRPDCRSGRTPCTHPPRGGGLGPPPDTPGYSPSDRLATFVRARDRRCRFPGCRARAVRCDVDHNIPWPHGATSEDNLCCLCRHHHRLRHQAPGWTMRRLPDGGLEWTLPGGEAITTYPP
ncbi:MAG: putative endonuclease, partial [Blastococcus sp.]|nr:putative endonuclease [Blastococcus sp.]